MPPPKSHGFDVAAAAAGTGALALTAALTPLPPHVCTWVAATNRGDRTRSCWCTAGGIAGPTPVAHQPAPNLVIRPGLAKACTPRLSIFRTGVFFSQTPFPFGPSRCSFFYQGLFPVSSFWGALLDQGGDDCLLMYGLRVRINFVMSVFAQTCFYIQLSSVDHIHCSFFLSSTVQTRNGKFVV